MFFFLQILFIFELGSLTCVCVRVIFVALIECSLIQLSIQVSIITCSVKKRHKVFVVFTTQWISSFFLSFFVCSNRKSTKLYLFFSNVCVFLLCSMHYVNERKWKRKKEFMVKLLAKWHDTHALGVGDSHTRRGKEQMVTTISDSDNKTKKNKQQQQKIERNNEKLLLLNLT